ncbi:hypothetical protein PISMIDRAFT_423632 [Pisolithus microcarpus 441]|uniref:Uncharacterized protein n=1 Tax=Pisolithus microcarpus 441 TaxID=765257 RepID=A0A0C9XKD3_9AGAM|nr:hypothetical protein PISMIDRAFT_423632 [Pisolithus microcarpus 441]
MSGRAVSRARPYMGAWPGLRPRPEQEVVPKKLKYIHVVTGCHIYHPRAPFNWYSSLEKPEAWLRAEGNMGYMPSWGWGKDEVVEQ